MIRKTNELKELLKKHVVQKYTNPFSRRFVEIVNDLDPIRQENMINALLEENQIFIKRRCEENYTNKNY